MIVIGHQPPNVSPWAHLHQMGFDRESTGFSCWFGVLVGIKCIFIGMKCVFLGMKCDLTSIERGLIGNKCVFIGIKCVLLSIQ